MEEKLVYTILALRVSPEEQSVQNAIHTKENIILHEKINNKIIDEATPLISSIVREGIKDGIFIMDDIVEERVRMSLILSNEMFDHTEITKESVYVFIDTLEKIYGAKKGTLSFIGNLIKEEQNEK